jgi:hypothetical protein
MWRIPAKVTISVETLSVETFLEGSPYRPEAVHQLLKLQAEYNWEGLTPVEKGTPRGDALFTPWSGGRDCRAAYR